MLADAKAGIPRPFTTAQGLTRPHGLRAIVNTFGDPTQRGWETQNIVTITAPAGQHFLPGQNTLRVHRLLAPNFNALFNTVHSKGLWREVFPSAGTFVCRTKHSYGSQPCGTPGIRFNQLSTHSWGITIDIRANNYPFYTAAMRQANTPVRYPPATIASVFQQYGFHFGLWFMHGGLDTNGRIVFDGADGMHFQFATGH
jgi:hypothetical protein